MPPKANSNKIATAIAAVNRTVVRNVKAANRAVVKNYNAANRAINRAPAWVKWTIAAIAVAIIGYALWKVFFAGKKEGFQTYIPEPGFPDEGTEALAYGQTMSLRQMGGNNFFWDIDLDKAKAECDKLAAECEGFAISGNLVIFMKSGYKINTQNTGWTFYKKGPVAVENVGTRVVWEKDFQSLALDTQYIVYWRDTKVSGSGISTIGDQGGTQATNAKQAIDAFKAKTDSNVLVFRGDNRYWLRKADTKNSFKGVVFGGVWDPNKTLPSDQFVTVIKKSNSLGLNTIGDVESAISGGGAGATVTDPIVGQYNGFNVWRLARSQDLGITSLVECMRKVLITPIIGTDNKKYRSGTWHKDASGTTGSCWAKDFSSADSETEILMDDAVSMFTYDDPSFPDWERFKEVASELDPQTRKISLETWLKNAKRVGSVAAIPDFDLNAANRKVSETKGYEDFTGTGFDGVDFSGGAMYHGPMSVEACVDKVRSGVIRDMVYDKANKKCYGKPINYDDVKDGKQKTFYNQSMYSASWHPSLKNMKTSQDRFILVNKGDTLERYWMDHSNEFKAVKGWNYKDVTAWMYEYTGTKDKWRIINSNNSRRLALDSGNSYLKTVHAGDDGDYTHFTMEKIPGTVEEYYIKTSQGAFITTWIKDNNENTLYASLASTPVDLNNPSIKWVKIPYFTA